MNKRKKVRNLTDLGLSGGRRRRGKGGGLLWRNQCCSREGTIAIDDDDGCIQLKLINISHIKKFNLEIIIIIIEKDLNE